MPVWLQIALGVLALVAAIGGFYRSTVRPLIRFAARAEEMYPLLLRLTATFADAPDSFRVLKDIASQFRTDSGSSLRDVVNRLEYAADLSNSQLEHVKLLLDRLGVKVTAIAVEAESVKVDLVASHRAADRTASALPPGSAADAASRSPDGPK